MGSNRPDAFDPTLSCGQGFTSNGVVVFCCGTATTPSCTKDTNVVCPLGTTGFECSGSGLPNEGQLGVDESRSDAPLLCSLPSSARVGVTSYCCFTPTQPPVGATCFQDQAVEGCLSGAFGFSCTGTDTPEEDYPRVQCTASPTHGVDPRNAPALLYCCTFTQ